MKRFCLAIFIAIVSFAIAFSGCSTTLPIVGKPSDGTYIPYRNGEESRVLLVSSELRYGTYDTDVFFPIIADVKKAVKGDDAVIISGTIRNGYEEDLFIMITADLYDSEGDKVGTILSPNAPVHGFAVVFVTRASVSPFEIWVKYDQQDVTEYELFLAYPPSTWPPP